MTEEIQFEKYDIKGASYHYKQINKSNLKKFNAFVYARYIKHIQLIRKQLKKFNFEASQTVKILDIGCGDGVLLFLINRHLKEYKFEFYGIDLSAKALKVARTKLPPGNFSEEGVYDLSFKDNSFDLVISSDVIEHVQFPEKMLAEIKRVSKSNAIIIIGTPVRHTEKPLDKMHVKEFFQQEFINLVSNSFNFVELVESHKQIHLLKYIKQSKFLKIGVNRYFYNLLSVLGKNPFLEKIYTSRDFPVYMYVVCIN